MEKLEQEEMHKELKALFQELKKSSFHNFNLAFTLMSVMPLLIFLYLLIVKYFTIKILEGHTGLLLTLTIVMTILGYYLGYVIIRKILEKIMFYAAASKAAYRKLRRAQRKLVKSARMAAIGQLAGGVAHEVKNPLATIVMCANYLERQPELSREEELSKIGTMKDAIFKVDGIVCSLLNFAKRGPLKLESRGINDVISTVLGRSSEKFEMKNIKVNTELGTGLPMVIIDESQMRQAFGNIVDCCLQTIEEGKEVTFRTYAKKLTETRIGVGRRESDLFKIGEVALFFEMECTGDGPMVPQEESNDIFDFLAASQNPGGETDLGLVIMKSIVEEHQGIVDIEDREGHCMRLTIILPTDRS